MPQFYLKAAPAGCCHVVAGLLSAGSGTCVVPCAGKVWPAGV